MMAENVTPIFSPNTEKMKEHLSYLFGSTPSAYDDGLIEISILNASKYFNVRDLDGAIEQAVTWNNQGKNVYTCPAVLSPDLFANIEKRKQADIEAKKEKKGYRAEGEDFYCSSHVWVDVDEIEESKIPDLKAKYSACPPDYYVKTSTSPPKEGSKDKRIGVHFWWSVNDIIDLFEAEKMELANKHLIANLMGDKGTHNRTRLMRLGGTISYPKKDYRVTEMVICQNTANKMAFSLDEIIKSYPVTEEKPLFEPAPEYKPKNNSLSPFNIKSEWSLDDVQSMLDYVDADGNGVYDDWLAIGMALKDYGVPFGIYDAWCSKGSKYKGTTEERKKWDSFNGKGRSIGTLYYHAEKAGWRPMSIEKKIDMVLNKPKEESFNPETGETEDQPEQSLGNTENRGRFYYDNAPDIGINLDVNDFVQGLLTENTMSVVYGASNCGKTFFMSDLSFHVAQGKEWRNKRVEKGNVMYLSLEGQRGIDNRINAYKLENKVDINGFLRVPCPINFVSEKDDDIPLFVEFVKGANSKFGSDIKLIVIDTLARALGGGDENSGVDMGLLVKHSDLIRQHTKAHICFIHHSGKDESKKARGHSSLRAAVDTEIEISRKDGDDFSNIKIQKQRDMDIGDDMQFKLKRIVLGQNKYNEDVTSCVVEPYILSEDVEARINKRAQKPAIKKAYDATLECVDKRGIVRGANNLPRVKTITYEDFKEGLAKRGIIELGTAGARSVSSRIRKDLIEADLIVCRDDYLWIKE